MLTGLVVLDQDPDLFNKGHLLQVGGG